MRHYLLLFIALLTVTAAGAQKHLGIGQLFNKQNIKKKLVTETYIVGDRLQHYNLDTYHSLAIHNDSLARKAEELVLKDGAKALQKEVSYQEGHLYYGFYTLSGESEIYDYIFYLDQRLKGGKSVNVIYMSGEATPERVKKMLKK